MWLAQLMSPRNLVRLVGALLLAGGVLVIDVGLRSPLVWFIAAVGAATLVLSFFADRALAGQRRREAQAFAQMHGWVYHEQLSGVLAMLRTPPFSADVTRYVDVIAGTFRGYECFDGTFEWQVRFDRDFVVTGSHRVTVVRLADELPRLMLIPEGITSAISKLLGGQDRDFESSSFNRNWRVVCDNLRIAHDMLGPRVLARLDQLTPRAPLLFERGLAVRIDRCGTGDFVVGDTARRADRCRPIPAAAHHRGPWAVGQLARPVAVGAYPGRVHRRIPTRTSTGGRRPSAATHQAQV